MVLAATVSGNSLECLFLPDCTYVHLLLRQGSVTDTCQPSWPCTQIALQGRTNSCTAKLNQGFDFPDPFLFVCKAHLHSTGCIAEYLNEKALLGENET